MTTLLCGIRESEKGDQLTNEATDDDDTVEIPTTCNSGAEFITYKSAACALARLCAVIYVGA